MRTHRGFSLVELIAVIVLVAVIGAVGASRMFSQKVFELQAGRDLTVSAFFVAQQTALHQAAAVRLLTTSTTIDIRQDSNGDGSFSADESVRKANVRYPVTLPSGMTITVASFDYDRLGKTQAATLRLNKDGRSVDIAISATGYAQ